MATVPPNEEREAQKKKICSRPHLSFLLGLKPERSSRPIHRRGNPDCSLWAWRIPGGWLRVSGLPWKGLLEGSGYSAKERLRPSLSRPQITRLLDGGFSPGREGRGPSPTRSAFPRQGTSYPKGPDPIAITSHPLPSTSCPA